MTDFQAALSIAGKKVLVVGGGPEALSYIARLLQAGAAVTMVAETVTDALHELVERNQVLLLRRCLTSDDVSDAWLVIAASNDQKLNEQVQVLAAENRLLCILDEPASSPR
ncbi:MAG: NAD(P)-dependent oxidoreductase, partial [Antricoccus sp.]